MNTKAITPIGVSVRGDIEYRPNRATPYRARVRWIDPATRRRMSKSEAFESSELAEAWIDGLRELAAQGVSPATATMTLEQYGTANLDMAMRGLEAKTLDPYLAGWHKRVVPTVGHLAVTMITSGVVDRAVHAWITDGCGQSTVKNTLAAFVRVMEQALRDGLINRNPVQIKGWQREFARIEDELDDPRSLALADWTALMKLRGALVEASADKYGGWGDVVVFAACTAARIGEVSGCRVNDIDTDRWIWTVRRQTTPSPGGLIDKGTKGKRAREVPLIPEVQELVSTRLSALKNDPNARLFTGPRGGRISTAVLRDATHWDAVVERLGYEHLRRHDLRHTGLTWMADAGVPVHHLRKIAGHGSLNTTQRYLHPDRQSVVDAGEMLSNHLRSPRGPQLKSVGA
ncbi:integrase family protein [Mycobacteroides abscessus subsp. bolletii]|nr:integrase family protein [Mycobacteroides abscessus subsp. bolletii]